MIQENDHFTKLTKCVAMLLVRTVLCSTSLSIQEHKQYQGGYNTIKTQLSKVSGKEKGSGPFSPLN